MTRFDTTCLALLALLWIALWSGIVRHWDPSLGLEAEAPVAVALVLFAALGRPWRFTEALPRLNVPLGVLGAIVFGVGMVWFHTVVAVLGWNLLLWSWLWHRLDLESRGRAWSLALLPIMAFPWLKMDCHWLELFLRELDANASVQALHLMDVPAAVVDTTVCTAHLDFRVIDECAGLNMLSATLIVGSVLAFNQRRFTSVARTVIAVASLAILANCLRIVALGVIGVTTGTNISGPIHNITGVVVLGILFWVAFGHPLTMPVLRRFQPSAPTLDMSGAL
jgi:exosortase